MQVKLLILSAVCLGALQGQSVAVVTPSSGTTWSGWTGNQFAVSLTNASSAVQVCYTVDAYPATNPGPPGVISGTSGALLDAGCSNTPPFSFPVNSYMWANGSHQVYAAAYDSLGNTVATSSAVSFSILNTFPVACSGIAPNFTVSPSTSFSSNWSGKVTLTIAATTCTSDQFYASVLVEGIPAAPTSYQFSGSSLAMPIDTTQFPNGTRAVSVILYDTTNQTVYTSPGYSVSLAGEFSRNVTFANGAVPSYVTNGSTCGGISGGGRRLYMSPSSGGYGGASSTCTLTPTLINTDGSTNSNTNFMFGSNNTTIATVTWTCCTSASSTTITALTQGAAKIYSMAVQKTGTDGVPNAVSLSELTSTTLGTYPDLQDQVIVITGGTNCITGMYYIKSANVSGQYFLSSLSSPLSLQNYVTTASGTSCSWAVGPVRVSYVQSY